MRKIIVMLFVSAHFSLVFAQEDPFVLQQNECVVRNKKDVDYYFSYSQNQIDPYILKSVLINGVTNYMFDSASDIQLGALTKTELKLLRNMLFAKYGYVFSNHSYTEYFNNYDWYKPKSKNVTNSLSKWEKDLVKRIQFFESNDYANITKKELVGRWGEFYGGAAQEGGANLHLNQDGTFVYITASAIDRTTKYWGTWDYVSNKLILTLKEQNLLLGGYHCSDTDLYFKGYEVAKITYNKSINIELPILNTKLNTWLKTGEDNRYYKIGSSDFFKN